MDFGQLAEWFAGQWGDAKDFFNSTFFTSVIGAFFASFAGAYGAQQLAEKTKARDRLTAEIRDTNAATNVAFSLCNALLSIKGQHVRRLKEDLHSQRLALEEHNKKLAAGKLAPGTQFHFTADLELLSLPPLPIDVLQKIVFERLSLIGRPLNLATVLGQTLHELTSSLRHRNELIAGYKSGQVRFSAECYFGLPQGDSVDRDYPSTVDGIFSQTDDGIFFSQLLCKDLMEHGRALAKKFEKLYRVDAPVISEVDFGIAEKKGLVPSSDNYSDWMNKFVKKTKAPMTLWQRFKRRFVG